MKTKTETAYGVIPYRKDGGNMSFLIIHQKTWHDGKSYWVFPKGHPEPGESSEETARRELKEETNLEVKTIDQSQQVSVSYEFEKEGYKVDKTSIFFVAEVEFTDHLNLQKEEVIAAEWLSFPEARKKLTYENTRILLDEAYQHLISKV